MLHQGSQVRPRFNRKRHTMFHWNLMSFHRANIMTNLRQLRLQRQHRRPLYIHLNLITLRLNLRDRAPDQFIGHPQALLPHVLLLFTRLACKQMHLQQRSARSNWPHCRQPPALHNQRHTRWAYNSPASCNVPRHLIQSPEPLMTPHPRQRTAALCNTCHQQRQQVLVPLCHLRHSPQILQLVRGCASMPVPRNIRRRDPRTAALLPSRCCSGCALRVLSWRSASPTSLFFSNFPWHFEISCLYCIMHAHVTSQHAQLLAIASDHSPTARKGAGNSLLLALAFNFSYCCIKQCILLPLSWANLST